MINLLSCLLLASLTYQSNCSYWHPNPSQYIGDKLKEHINDIKFCDEAICITDASRMANWMNDTAKPCDNFYKYVCGSLLYYQARNERYPFQGLQQILYENINEQRRKVLSSSISSEDLRPHKIVKSMFQKCVDSKSIQKQGKQQMIDFMKSVGGFPMHEGASWNPLQFNKSKLFESFPLLMFQFFNIRFSIKKDENNSTLNRVTFQAKFYNKIETIEKNSKIFGEVLQEFGINRTEKSDLNDIKEFHESLITESNLFADISETQMSIKELNELLNSNLTKLTVNWKNILQSVFDFVIDDNFQVFVKNRDFVLRMMKIYDGVSDKLFANLFNIELLLAFRRAFLLYHVSDNERSEWGIERAQQRFEQCTRLVRENLPIAFTSLLIKRYTNPRMIEAATEVGKRTMENIVNHVENDESLPEMHKKVMVDKLKTAKLIVGFPEEMLSNKNINSFYEKLELTGDESFLKLFVDSFLFHNDHEFRKFIKLDDGTLVRKESTKWAEYTLEDELETPFYFFDTNLIYYPSLWFQTPYFHPDRPRFYKDTMFGAFLSYTVAGGLHDYMNKNNIQSRNDDRNHFDLIQVLYDNYANWVNTTNGDKILPGFLFSNEQMFWFTLIHKNCIKLQKGFSQEFNDERNAEAYFRETPKFHQLFGCDFSKENLTDSKKKERIKQFNEFY